MRGGGGGWDALFLLGWGIGSMGGCFCWGSESKL